MNYNGNAISKAILNGVNLSKMLINGVDALNVSTSIVTDGLVLWLDGKDFSNNPPTSLWNDKSGLGNNVVPSGFSYIKNTSGSDGNGGVAFDGVDDTCNAINLFNALPSVTIEIEADFSSNSSCVFGKECGFRLLLQSGQLTFVLSTVNNSWYSNGTTLNISAPNGFARVSCRYNGTYLSVFINGVLQATSTIPLSGTTAINDNPFAIGTCSGQSFFSKLTIKSFNMYNRALSDAEILKNYNVTR